MNLYLFNNGDDPNTMHKNLTAIGTAIDCQLTAETEIENPDILVSMNSNYMNANYFYIPYFNRYYYYRQPPTIINGEQIMLHGHVDVLMSHPDAINATLVIAERSSSHTNPYMPDPLVAGKGTIRTIYRKASATPFGFGSDNYVLTIGGK